MADSLKVDQEEKPVDSPHDDISPVEVKEDQDELEKEITYNVESHVLQFHPTQLLHAQRPPQLQPPLGFQQAHFPTHPMHAYPPRPFTSLPGQEFPVHQRPMQPGYLPQAFRPLPNVGWRPQSVLVQNQPAPNQRAETEGERKERKEKKKKEKKEKKKKKEKKGSEDSEEEDNGKEVDLAPEEDFDPTSVTDPEKRYKIALFMQMLKDHDVQKASQWEKLLSVFVFDKRFTAIPQNERKPIFNAYIRLKVQLEEQERQTKRDQAINQLKDLVQKEPYRSALRPGITFSLLLKAIPEKDREEIKTVAKPLGAAQRDVLLDEVIQAQEHQEAMEKAIADRKATEAAFTEWLRAHTASLGLHRSMSWIRVRERIGRGDAKFKVLSDRERENLFDEYVKTLPSFEEMGDEHKCLEILQDRVQTEEEWAIPKEEYDESPFKRFGEDRLDDKKRRKVQGEEEVTTTEDVHNDPKEDGEIETDERNTEEQLKKRAEEKFRQLLVKHVSEYDCSWRTIRSKIEDGSDKEDYKFIRHEMDSYEREKVFNSFVRDMRHKAESEFRELITSSCLDLGLDVTWGESVKERIRDDARYSALTSRDREYVFMKVVDEWKKEAFHEFENLLHETTAISHTTPTSGPRFDEICSFIKLDKRWKKLESCSEDRRDMIVRYINSLKKKFEKSEYATTQPRAPYASDRSYSRQNSGYRRY